jgi:nicotinamide phosphoribosyltransferase
MSTNIGSLFAPKETDITYIPETDPKISLILRVDSYKFSHPFSYPDENIEGMTSYGESRLPGHETIVPFGLQILLKRYLSQTVTMDDIDVAEAFSIAHFGRKLFDRAGWEKVVREYGGKLPLIIRATPEGMPVRGRHPIYTVTVLDRDLFYMSAAFETMIQRGVWYPTTIATMDHSIRAKIKARYVKSGADLNLLPFALHDFGGRGVTCAEQAEIGGASHLVHFMGSDTVEGVVAANFFYKHAMSAFSVYATEHAIECSFGGGREDALRYLRKQLKNAPEGSIVSIVIDGYDVFRESELLCTVLRDEIIDSKAKVVFRPDSGDMMEVIPRILRMQEMAFGYNLTSTGHKQIKHVGIIQGDGVDHAAIEAVLDMIIEMGYSADCVIFGSGGALLQKVNRDSLRFAQKACAILVDGEWRGIAKDPITDHGKKSKEGVLTLVRSRMTGELMTARLDTGPLNEEFEDVHKLVYYMGEFYNETTLSEVRERAGV